MYVCVTASTLGLVGMTWCPRWKASTMSIGGMWRTQEWSQSYESGNILTPNNGSYLLCFHFAAWSPGTIYSRPFRYVPPSNPLRFPYTQQPQRESHWRDTFSYRQWLWFWLWCRCHYMYFCDQPHPVYPKLELQNQSHGCFPCLVWMLAFIFTV